jgi:multicomponent Na+:H+ antiporter subunit E
VSAGRRFLLRFALFAAVWLVVSEGRPDFLIVGTLAAVAATLVSLRIWRAGGDQVRLVGLVRYLPGFLWRSLLGGLDVAQRVLRRRVRVAPVFVRHRLASADETRQVLLADILSLMPGTLGAGMERRATLVHLLADEPGLRRQLELEERRLDAVFARDR